MAVSASPEVFEPRCRQFGIADFHCPTHGDFKVADTVFAKAKDYTRDQWEAALDKAEERATADGFAVWAASQR